MRDFNEIKAEILRRSDNRIKEKKRRRKTYITCCVSLCFCITIAVLLMPKLLRFDEAATTDKAPFGDVYGELTTSKNEDAEMENGEMLDASAEDTFNTALIVVISAELKSEGKNLTLNQKDATVLSDFLQNLKALEVPGDEAEISEEIAEESKDAYVGETDEDVTVESSSAPTPDEYLENLSIVIKYSDGAKVNYKLSGNFLINEKTGESIFLTDSEYDFLIGFYS